MLDEESALTVTALTESLSGASPWGTQMGSDGQSELIMSGASISESRQDLTVKYTSYSSTYSTSFHGGLSQENDYRSFYWGGSIDKSFNTKNVANAIKIVFIVNKYDIDIP